MVCKRTTVLHIMWGDLGHKRVFFAAWYTNSPLNTSEKYFSTVNFCMTVTYIIKQMQKLRKKNVKCFAPVVLWKGKNGRKKKRERERERERNPDLNYYKIILLPRYRHKQNPLIFPFPFICCAYCFLWTPSVKIKLCSGTSMWTSFGKLTTLELGKERQCWRCSRWHYPVRWGP